MKIKRLVLNNFRNFQNETVFDFDDLTVIVGKNDLGKSTVLEALDIFINEKNAVIKIDKDDACKRTDEDEFSIGVTFSDFPNEVDIDEGNMTSLKDEYLLNKEGFLEIHKRYENGKNTGVYIKALHPTAEGAKDLLLRKRQELKKIVDDNDYECENKTKNASLREAIRENTEDLHLQEIYISADEEDAKKIWSKLQNYLPVYALFQSDRANKDEDREVQDPMKLAIKEILQKEKLQSKLKDIAKEVEDISEEIVQRTLTKLSEMNPDIAKELKAVIPPAESLKWESVFKNIEISSDDGVPLNKRGSGVRRLVLLNFFRARAEEKKDEDSKSNVVYAIEEPETSQHPKHQKILISALKDLAEQEDRQIFITTHSPSLVQLLPRDNVRLLRKGNEDVEVVGGDLAISEIIDDLGVLPIIGKVAIFVEGENDRQLLLELNSAISELKTIIDISKLAIIPLGGSTLERWVNRNYLDGSNIAEFHLYDKDSDEKYKQAIEKINDRQDISSGRLTEKLEIENYIHPSLVEDCTRFNGISCDEIKDAWSDEDIPNYVVGKTGIEEKIVKQIICCSLSKKMTKQLLEEIEAWDEIKKWFEDIKVVCNATK
jgi:predicted ATP-dependent endonuclease of OLD family